MEPQMMDLEMERAINQAVDRYLEDAKPGTFVDPRQVAESIQANFPIVTLEAIWSQIANRLEEKGLQSTRPSG